jgi:hypothetical protein
MANHVERTPADCAAAASGAIRALNHLTIDPRACTLDDAYAVLGALGDLCARLEQSSRQIAEVLQGRLLAGGLQTDVNAGATPARLVDACLEDLAGAGSVAARLEALISTAHRRVGMLADTPTPQSASGSPSAWPTRRPMPTMSRSGPSRSA